MRKLRRMKPFLLTLQKFKNMNKVAENPLKNRDSGDMLLVVITALFVTAYLVSNIMAVKVIGIFNFLYFDAGTVTFPFAYMLGDVLTEIWGYRTAKKVILLTFLCNLIMVISTQIGVWLPSPDYMDVTAQSYNTIFNYVPRIVIASLAGFLIGELSNAWLMERIKVKMGKSRLWIRTIVSSVVAYVLDTVLFVLIAFAGTIPWRDILLMIALQYVMKIGIEVFFGTPLAYSMIGFINKKVAR